MVEVSDLVFDVDALFEGAEPVPDMVEVNNAIREYHESKEYKLKRNKEMNQVAQLMGQVVGCERY